MDALEKETPDFVEVELKKRCDFVPAAYLTFGNLFGTLRFLLGNEKF